MAAETPPSTPPPIPRKGNRPRQQTQELGAAELEELDSPVKVARTLVKKRIKEGYKDFYGKPYLPHPAQAELGTHIDMSKIREGKPMLSHTEFTKVQEAIAHELEKAGIAA